MPEQGVFLLDGTNHGSFLVGNWSTYQGDRSAIPPGTVDFPAKNPMLAGDFDYSMPILTNQAGMESPLSFGVRYHCATQGYKITSINGIAGERCCLAQVIDFFVLRTGIFQFPYDTFVDT